MGSPTSRVALWKPDPTGSDFVNVVTDINNNMDKIDSWLGATVCTSGTHPASPWLGQTIYETDTAKAYLCTGTGPAVWTQLLLGAATFATGINTASGISTGGSIAVTRGTSGSLMLTGKQTADTIERFAMQADGLMSWGAGGASSRDTILFRSAANVLKTDDSFQVGTDLTVSGTTTLADLDVTGSLDISGARYRNSLSSQVTVANSSAETVIASDTVPANDVSVGAVFRIKGYGTLAVAAATTPSMTFRLRIGGVAGTLLMNLAASTARSGMTDGVWTVEGTVTVLTTGGSGTWAPVIEAIHNINTVAMTPQIALPGGSVTRDTTISNDLVLTAQWNTANASNTLTCRGFVAERVA